MSQERNQYHEATNPNGTNNTEDVSTESSKNTVHVKSAERAFTILELLAEKRSRHQGWTISDVSRRLSIPKSSASDLLHLLARRGYAHSNELKQYTLGIKLLGLCEHAMKGMTEQLSKVSTDHLRNIVEKTKLGAHLAMLRNGDAIYMERIEAPGSFVKMNIWIGRHMAPQITAIGRALICYHDEISLRNIVRQHPEPLQKSPKANLDLHYLLAELEKTRKRGYAIDDEETALGVRCLAAPVFAVGHKVVAALGVSATTIDLPLKRVPHVAAIVAGEAQELSRKLGDEGE